MRRARSWITVAAGLFALVPAGAMAKDRSRDPRARCAEVSAFLQDVLPAWVRPGDVVVREAIGTPIDIFAAAGAAPRRLTSDSIFWKSGFAPAAAPSPELVSNWLAVQKYSATDCAGRLLARWKIKTRRRAWGHDPKDRVLSIGYPGFDRSRREALLYVMQGGPYLTGEDMLLRFTKVGGHWKEVARILMGQT